MNIRNFRNEISNAVLFEAEQLVERGKIMHVNMRNNVLTGYCYQSFESMNVRFDHHGEIISAACSCDFLRRNHRICCHIAALLIYAERYLDPNLFDTDKKRTADMIRNFGKLAEQRALSKESLENVSLVPTLSKDFYTKGRLIYTLKIGSKKMYVVKSIRDLYQRFLDHETYRYGKDLTLTHDPSVLSERDYQLLRLSESISMASNHYYGDDQREFVLTSGYLDEFFELYRDESVLMDGKEFRVCFENPEYKMKIEKANARQYRFCLSSDMEYMGSGKHACFLDVKGRKIYLADPGYSEIVSGIQQSMGDSKELLIDKNSMQAFYNAVLKQIGKYIQIEGVDRLEDYAPPEVHCRLYVDSSEEGVVYGHGEYQYGEKVYPFFYPHASNPFCDYETEALVENAVNDYFLRNTGDESRPLFIEKEKDIYRLMSEGLSKLTSLMEVFTTERFNHISVRPPANAVVGIRPGAGKLLELDITAEGYTNDELVQMLTAYRKGKKYYRLKDGSFAPINDSFAELSELASNLNLSDKALLKENITIPQYRMLYLDSMSKDCEALRIERSKEFQKMMNGFRTSVENEELYSLPESMERIMREYQKYGYRWMKTIAGYGFGGILADDMGLGKTIQAFALMLDAKANHKKTSFVVCPSSLILNWENEIHKFAPSLRCMVIAGSAAVRSEQLSHMEDYDVIVTSYSLLVRDIAEYENLSFYYEFIDEAQYIKNHGTQMAKAVKAINAEVRFALTGTPVENSLAELWSIFDFVMPGYLFSYKHFKENFETPIVVKKDDVQIKALQKNVSPFILRRLKKEVLSELPDKTISVLRADMGEEQSKLYSANVADMKNLLEHNFESQSDRFKILAMITRLRQICCDPALVYENYDGGSAKLDQCMDLVKDCIESGHKILLFSQFTSMLEVIAKRLKDENISFYTLTGSTSPKNRIELVDRFNTDDTNVFLISLKAGGTGLNLTGADIVIHYDPWWNVSAENQASDRAYRIGQKRNVQIYKLIANKTIEEKIILLQESKSELFDIAVNGTGDIMRMNAEDILGLLE